MNRGAVLFSIVTSAKLAVMRAKERQYRDPNPKRERRQMSPSFLERRECRP